MSFRRPIRDSRSVFVVKMKRPCRRRGYSLSQRRNRRSASRMNRIRKNHHKRIAVRIHPQRRAGKSRMPKTPNRKHVTPRPRKRPIDIPPKPSRGDTRRRLPVLHKDRCPATRCCRLLRLRHQFQRLPLQWKITSPPRQPIQQSLRKDRYIARCRKHSCMARDPTHPACRGVMHCASQQMVVVRIRLFRPLVIMLRRRGIPRPFVRRPIAFVAGNCGIDTSIVEGKTSIRDRITDGLVQSARLFYG